ncbi:MAG: hypothetical protein WC130_03830 [Kiritimatiellia bacterium]
MLKLITDLLTRHGNKVLIIGAVALAVVLMLMVAHGVPTGGLND